MNSNTFQNQKLLLGVPLFNSLSDDELTTILQAPENGIEEYGAKQIIIKETEIGNCMYIIIDGTAEVSIKGESDTREFTIATLKTGDFFGEQALLPEGTGRRNATVRSLHPVKLFRIDKKFVLLHIKSDIDESNEQTIPPTDPEIKKVHELITNMRLFKSLTPEEIIRIDEWTKTITVGPGEFVLKESEPGDSLYVVLDGSVEVFTLDSDGKITVLAKHKPGTYFGEQALLPNSNGKRSCYVRTNDKSRLIRVPKECFHLILKRDTDLENKLLDKAATQRKEVEGIKNI